MLAAWRLEITTAAESEGMWGRVASTLSHTIVIGFPGSEERIYPKVKKYVTGRRAKGPHSGFISCQMDHTKVSDF